MRTIDISQETLEALTLSLLKQDMEMVKNMLADDSDWHHKDDIKKYRKTVKAFKRIIEFYSVEPYEADE